MKTEFWIFNLTVIFSNAIMILIKWNCENLSQIVYFIHNSDVSKVNWKKYVFHFYSKSLIITCLYDRFLSWVCRLFSCTNSLPTVVDYHINFSTERKLKKRQLKWTTFKSHVIVALLRLESKLCSISLHFCVLSTLHTLANRYKNLKNIVLST